MSRGTDHTSATARLPCPLNYKTSLFSMIPGSWHKASTQKELLGKLICIIVSFLAGPGLIKSLMKPFPQLSCCHVTVLN